MQPDDRQHCVALLVQIQAEGGPDKASADLIENAKKRKLVKSERGGVRYTIKGNRLRGELVLQAGAGVAATSIGDGAVVDATIGKHTVRGKVTGTVGDLVRVEHVEGGKKTPMGVPPDSIVEVDKATL